MRTTGDEPNPLTGLLRDGHDRRLSPRHAARPGKRYRYYVSNVNDDARDEPCWRISAPDLATLVAAKLADVVGRVVDAHIAMGSISGDAIETLKATARAVTAEIQGLSHAAPRFPIADHAH